MASATRTSAFVYFEAFRRTRRGLGVGATFRWRGLKLGEVFEINGGANMRQFRGSPLVRWDLET